jgi:NADH:ubiquinone oxidoreductase subunit H
MSVYLTNLLITLLLAILKVVCLLIAIAYFTLAERKIMAAVQRRVGPNVVGPFGLLQPLADGLKLAGKELAVPAQASSRIFLTVAITVLLFALSGWAAIPFGLFDHSEYLDNFTVVEILSLDNLRPPLAELASTTRWQSLSDEPVISEATQKKVQEIMQRANA